ncbi:MAG: DEAD/DEAH box helicase family protein, partial [Verrucomicrobiota bacterium]
HCKPHLDAFERLWANKSSSTAVIDLPEACVQKLIHICPKGSPPSEELESEIWDSLRFKSSTKSNENTPKVPKIYKGKEFLLRDHQTKALNDWKTIGDGHGIFALATGAGKTITAIYGIVKMSEAVQGLTVIISVPYQNLADQWCDELEHFNIIPIKCYQNKQNWAEPLDKAIHQLKSGNRKFLALVVVNRTLTSPDFQEMMKEINGGKLLWIGDECHHHSSATYSKFLPSHAKFRIGLSATPEHYLDESRNDRLESYYGQVIARYTLKEAIEDKHLTPYEYHVIPIELTANEAEEYIELSQKVSKLFSQLENQFSEQTKSVLDALLRKRSRLLGSAKNKSVALSNLLSDEKPQKHTLFYCGDGRVETDNENDEDDVRQVEQISMLLSDLGWDCSRFTSQESRKEREAILENFRLGVIDCMVAIRCLDEGIDIPACSKAYFLASSRNPRQFIQRRGRVLRKAIGKDKAVIYDLLVTLPDNVDDNEDGYARDLVVKELERVVEFTELSQNKHDAFKVLRPILKKYDLAHMV